MLTALEGNSPQFVADGTPPGIAETQDTLPATDLATVKASMSECRADSQVAAAARDEALTQAAKPNETIPLIDKSLDAFEALFAKRSALRPDPFISSPCA